LPEAAAGIALCVEPLDIFALTDALQKALTDTAYRALCTTQASTVAQKFSAHAMATHTIAAYEQAALLHASRRQAHFPTFVQ
jgi:hypothetical protein